MKITLYQDQTLKLRLDDIVANLNRLAPSINIEKGRAQFSIPSSVVSAPESYQHIDTQIDRETADSDEVLLLTEKPYDNNYFWEANGNRVIISLYGCDYSGVIARSVFCDEAIPAQQFRNDNVGDCFANAFGGSQ